ncbi:MAG: glycosyltransferase family 39 protein [Acidobacteria bacterium]|nr:glycosyltransferase family 39 protein [Acidobacteriota bacterium]
MGIVALALAARLVAAWASGVGAPQEIRYITIASGIRAGLGFVGLDGRFPDLIQPPVYPLLLAATQFLTSHSLGAARALSALMGALLVLPVAAITRRLFDRRTMRRTAWLVAVYPLLVHISSLCMTEPAFTLFVALAVLGVVKATHGDREVPNLCMSGAFLGVAFLTRPEGFPDTLATSALVLYWAWRLKRRSLARALALAAIPAAICLTVAAPYWIWLHGATGHWMLSPKVALTQAHQSIMRQGLAEHWPERYGTRLFYERVKFGLNESGTDFLASPLFRDLGLIHGEGERREISPGASSQDDASYLAWIVFRNARQLYLDTIKYGLVLPTLLLGFLALGVTSRPWRSGTERFSQGTILWFALSGCSWVLSYVEARFLYPSIVFMLPWMATGWERVELWLRESIQAGSPARARLRDRAIAWGLLILVASACLVHVPPPVRLFSSIWAEHEIAGTLLKKGGAERGPVMALTPVAAFYAGFPAEVLPYADLDRVIAYARLKGVKYLVADMAEFPNDRPQLMSLLDPAHAPPDLTMLHDINRDPSRRLIVYRLNPPAPPGT